MPSMSRAPVELRVGGQTYRVVASSGDDDLRRLAGTIDARLRDLGPGRSGAPNSMLLVAMSLAHDLEEAHRQRAQVEERSREMLRTVLARVDAAIDSATETETALEPAQPTT